MKQSRHRTGKQFLDPDATNLTVGEVACRSGVAVSTVHYYEARNLISGWRTASNQRRYSRGVLRRIAIIKMAQRLGISLAAIQDAFRALPQNQTPTVEDWARMSACWRDDLDNRITQLTRFRDYLSGCIGCGCLSLESCPLYNPRDKLAQQGSGARLLELS